MLQVILTEGGQGIEDTLKTITDAGFIYEIESAITDNFRRRIFNMNQTQSSTLPRSKTYEITITALMTAVICILAPMSIPIGPVPISFY